jgi:hypothetical protein
MITLLSQLQPLKPTVRLMPVLKTQLTVLNYSTLKQQQKKTTMKHIYVLGERKKKRQPTQK